MSAITNPAVKEVRGYIRELSADEKARQLAEARAKALRDEASLLEDAEKRGLEKGRQEGRQEGALAAKRETLLSLIQLKFGAQFDDKDARLNTADKEQLDRWIAGVLTASSLDELLNS